ncbi:MAG TPA: hypothetical protein PKC82_11750 [Chitinophagaceae bacterium]|nr:hypothetical protein [Chitinophagaceae bacterium]HMW67595.1 hypothetical protein [Chitinophagaceae bacterium]HMX76646.1 hypothetical protein [Chitinophagaceae bacterium]HNA90788.1 hypothetical protein [Chitinophagaceae bacterium]HNA95764.1 hypothetical protein [Chitinophagaceae bacterium]
MKNRHFIHSHQSAKIYKKNYRSSINLVRFVKSVLAVMINGSAAASTHYYHKR